MYTINTAANFNTNNLVGDVAFRIACCPGQGNLYLGDVTRPGPRWVGARDAICFDTYEAAEKYLYDRESGAHDAVARNVRGEARPARPGPSARIESFIITHADCPRDCEADRGSLALAAWIREHHVAAWVVCNLDGTHVSMQTDVHHVTDPVAGEAETYTIVERVKGFGHARRLLGY